MPAVLLLGEAYQRQKRSREILRSWYDKLGKPEYYRLEANDLTPGEFHQHLCSNSLFSESKILHVTHLEESEEQKSLASVLKDADLRANGLLLEADSLKKSSTLYKNLKKSGKIEKFDQVNDKNFPGFFKKLTKEKGLSFDSAARRWMIRVMEPDLVHLDNELEKLKNLNEGGRLSKDLVREVLWTKGRGDLFDFLDSFSDRNVAESTKLLSDLLDSGEEEGKIFFMLAREIRMLLSAKDLAERGLSKKEIASKMGTYPWLAGKKSSQAGKFSKEELRGLLMKLMEMDKGVKTGKRKYLDSLYEMVLRTSA